MRRTSPLKDLRPRRLSWDGAIDNGNDFRWVVRHQQQTDPSWCWAACVRNALSCFAVEVTVERIVERYHRRFPGSARDDDQRIPPDRILDLWIEEGFRGARHVAEPLPETDLQRELRENGPVELLLWAEGHAASQHLVLVTGFQSSNGVTSYRISDPLAPAETIPGPTYAGLCGVLPSGYQWKETFFGLEHRGRNSLLRFVPHPARFYSRFDLTPANPLTGSPREPMFAESALQVEDVYAPNYFDNEMLSALSGYRYIMSRRADARVELGKTLWRGESLPMVSHRRKLELDRALRDQWTPHGWSSVVYLDGRERYYVRSELLDDGAWYSRWVGEKHARSLASGLRALSRIAVVEEEVQVVRVHYTKPYRNLYLLRLVESDRYLVARVRGHERPLNELMDGGELARRLRKDTPQEFARGLTEIGDDVWGWPEPLPAAA